MKTFNLLLIVLFLSIEVRSTQLSGTYSINPSISATTTNFQDFSSAITFLTNSGIRSDGGPSNSSPFGVSGAVTFQIAAGTYNVTSSINIPAITGANTTNKITFDGGNASSCLVRGVIDSSSIFILNQCFYITLLNFSITNLDTGICAGVSILGNSINTSGTGCSIKNCSINLPNTIYPDFSSCIYAASLLIRNNNNPVISFNANNIEIDNNIFTGGYSSVYILGASSTIYNFGLKIRNNICKFAYGSSINLRNIYNGIDLFNNTISHSEYALPSGSGISLTTCINNSGTSHNIFGNKISNVPSIGINLYQCGGGSSNPIKIYNNMICGGFSYSAINYGIQIYNTGVSYSEVYYNSVYMDFAAGTVYGLYHNGAGGSTVKNNIFICDVGSATGSIYPTYFLNSLSGSSINYNIYYNKANSNIIYRGASFSSSNYLAPNAGGDSSFNMLPMFRNKFDLHLANICTPKGVNLSSIISIDIDSNVRDTIPNIGCDELNADSNDISVQQILYPYFPISSGSQNLRVRITNNGLNIVTSFYVSYKLNNGVAISEIWTGNLNPCDTTSVLFSGSKQINLISGINTIIIYSTLPNNTNDRYKLNDTLIKELSTPLSGTYLIGTAPSNFVSINSAVSSLVNSGISGTVTFNIKSGVYYESFVLGSISGVSANNRIIFKSLAENPDSVRIINNSNSIFTVKISSGSYIKLKYLSLSIPGTVTNSTIISFEGNSSFDTIESCKLSRNIIANTNSNYPMFSISGNQVLTQNIVIRNNIISGGNVHLYGVSTTLPMLNTVFEGNKVLNDLQPIDIKYQNGLLFRNNNIFLNKADMNGYCKVIFWYLSNTLIINNTITNDSIVTNPDITFINYSNNNVGIYNNSVHTVNHSTQTSIQNGRILFLYNPTYTNNGIAILNNVFSHLQNPSDTTSGNYRIFFTGPLPVSTSIMRMDYNNYYSTTSTLIFSNINYNNITSWKLFCNCDSNSLSYRPGFTSNVDLTPNPFDSACWSLNGRGTHLSLVPRDINDSLRPPNYQSGVPDIGAYEFNPLVEPPYAKAIPAAPSAGTTQHFTFGEDTVARIKWDASYPVPAALGMKNYSGNKPPATFNGASYLRSYWKIDSLAPAFYNYDILLRYKNPWLGTNQNETNLLLARNNDSSNSGWNVFTTSSSVDTLMNYMTVTSINDFHKFYTGTNSNNPLPVKLLHISAHKININAIVNWTTAQEINTNRFEVERAIVIGNWSLIGKVKAAGNSNSIKIYQFIDNLSSFQKPASNIIYYRLRIIDIDGSFSDSKIVSINLDEEAEENISVFPNPFDETVFIKVASISNQQAKITLRDITGKIISTEHFGITSGLTLCGLNNVAALQNGLYFLTIELNGKAQTIKIVKK